MTKKEFVQSERLYTVNLLNGLSLKQWQATTLCKGWTVEDIAAHLVARERSIYSDVGLVVPSLHHIHDKKITHIKAKGHSYLIKKLSHYPWWMPAVANTAEFYIHNEDILRGSLKMSRPAPSKEKGEILWRALQGLVKIRKDLLQDLGNVQLENTQSGAVLTIKNSHVNKDTVFTGLPGELLLFCYGRRDAAKVKITTAKI